MKNLRTEYPVDNELKVVKDSDGNSTALEVSKDKVRVRDLEVTGTIVGINEESTTVDSSLTDGSTNPVENNAVFDGLALKLDLAGGSLTGDIRITDSTAPQLVLKYDANNYCVFELDSNGATTLATTDHSTGTDGDIILDADGDMILDSATGVFSLKNNGTEFSMGSSSYAGMLIGCSHIFGSGANGTYVEMTTSWANLLWDTDKYALVTFVVPPSNKVKISVFLPYCQLSGYILQLGLATDSSATTLNTKYENQAWDVDETDTVAINHSWIVSGSDHSWSAGETKTLYIMAYADGSSRLYTGGTNTDKYGGVIVEATALPATIGDGSEP